MTLRIRPLTDDDIAGVLRLSMLAWAPIFRSFQEILGPEIYPVIYPDWQPYQSRLIEKICRMGDGAQVWVADVDGTIAGFIACVLNDEEKIGEVEYLAVHPDYHNRGIAAELNALALEKMKASGMKVAVVNTGGDPSHAAARRSYEKAGYTALPLVRYYQEL